MSEFGVNVLIPINMYQGTAFGHMPNCIEQRSIIQPVPFKECSRSASWAPTVEEYKHMQTMNMIIPRFVKSFLTTHIYIYKSMLFL